MTGVSKSSLTFTILSECNTSRARASIMKVPHSSVETPTFMPVGTQGTIKGILPQQLEKLNYQLILANTYHLGLRPGVGVLTKAGGLHKYMGWDRALLTDSGGFQMVSLLKLSEVSESGVKFMSPFDVNEEMLLTPEESIAIQNVIGADIIMQLDDVIKTTSEMGPRVKEATERTTRWLDRCLKAHQRTDDQSIFPVVQGWLDNNLRLKSVQELKERDCNGYAIGGLSGGEDKNEFWRVVHLCLTHLDKNKPRYVMGVGHPVDMVVCCALGADMFDCVYPTRTARFGCALYRGNQINLRLQKFKYDFEPIDPDCSCPTCKRYTKAFLYTLASQETVGCHLLTIHNLAYCKRLMNGIRESIKNRTFVDFVKNFMIEAFPDKKYPKWVIDALQAVSIQLDVDEAAKFVDGNKEILSTAEKLSF